MSEDLDRVYGRHSYGGGAGEGLGNCECGCWMADSDSGGPAGLDPFGECPNNPQGGSRLGGSRDQEVVICRRINRLTQTADAAEARYRAVEPGAKKLARELAVTRRRLTVALGTLSQIKEILRRPPKLTKAHKSAR